MDGFFHNIKLQNYKYTSQITLLKKEFKNRLTLIPFNLLYNFSDDKHVA